MVLKLNKEYFQANDNKKKKIAGYKLRKHGLIEDLYNKILDLDSSSFDKYGQSAFRIKDCVENMAFLRDLEEIESNDPGWLMRTLIEFPIEGRLKLAGISYPIDCVVYINDDMREPAPTKRKLFDRLRNK